MAIDSENKRRSVAMMYARLTVMPIADGTIDGGDLAQARWLYSGLTYQTSAKAPHRKWFGEDFYRTRYR
jgi:hypothetical protein